MCAPLAVVGAGIAAAGTLVGGVQSLMQGNYQAKVAQQNASMDMDAAHDSERQGRDEALQFWRQIGQTKGEQIAAMAANGVDLSFGSPLRVQQDTAMLADEDAARLYRNTEERTKGYLIDAWNARSQAASARAQGRAALIGSAFQAGSTLVSSFQQQSALKAKMGIGG